MALWLPSLNLSSPETDAIGRLLKRLARHQHSNGLKAAYYDGEKVTNDLGISIPPELRDINTVLGWPALAVDVLEERLDLLGWALTSDDDFGLAEAWDTNELAAESSIGHIDALQFGVAFIRAGAGVVAEGEPEVLVTVETPRTMTVEWSRRSRRVTAALAVTASGTAGEPKAITLMLPDVTIRAERAPGGHWHILDRDDHQLGRVTVSRLVNRARGSNRAGQSEITHTVRSLTDHAVRTLVGAEVAREFFSAPQRWVMGADAGAFVDQHGRTITPWESYTGRILALSGDEDGNLPTVGQFDASSPEPFWSSLRGLATLLASEVGFPTSYLGLTSDTAPSADSVRALEARLLKRAERRHTQFGPGWKQAAHHVAMIRQGSAVLPAEFMSALTCLWRDPATPTRAAAADAAAKLVSTGVLPAESSVTWELIGLSPDQQRRLATDLARRRFEAFATGATVEANDDVKPLADAMGVLIRSGVSPETAAARVGLDGLEFTGAIPTSLRVPEAQAADLEA